MRPRRLSILPTAFGLSSIRTPLLRPLGEWGLGGSAGELGPTGRESPSGLVFPEVVEPASDCSMSWEFEGLFETAAATGCLSLLVGEAGRLRGLGLAGREPGLAGREAMVRDCDDV